MLTSASNYHHLMDFLIIPDQIMAEICPLIRGVILIFVSHFTKEFMKNSLVLLHGVETLQMNSHHQA